LEDAFVTGLEPATGFPNFKDFERESGRVVNLAPGEHWEASWELEPVTNAERLGQIKTEIQSLSGQSTVYPLPNKDFTPHGK
jgi:hypothetical protein